MRLRSLPGAAQLLVVPLLAVGLGAEARAAEAPDLIGTWYVLIHYRDQATANPDADRWEDKVWVFSHKGSRLQWTEYPIVVFEDTSGRFEKASTGQRARVLAAWEPNEAQLAQILEGPRVNSRGSKTKTLRGSPERGYESFGQMRAMSASVLSYHETWSIGNPTGLPVFTRDDVLGSGRAQKAGDEGALEGRTQYVTLEVDDGELRGTFSRDETRRGVFRMMRSGPVQGLPTDGKTPNEKMAERIEQEVVREMERRLDEGDPEAVRELEEGMRQQRERRP